MNIFLIIIIVLISIVVIFLIYRNFKVNRQSKKLNTKRFERVSDFLNKIENKESISKEYIFNLCEKIETREMVFQILKENNKLELFPKDLNTIIKSAESNLVNWLEFPTELDTIPDEIEHLEECVINFDDEKIFYQVFKFKINEPHWAAKDHWMLGVVGPYFEDSKPYDFPHATFSRLSKFGSLKIQDEVNWVHNNIAMRK